MNNTFPTYPLRKNHGSQRSIWWRWFRQEGWIVALTMTSLIGLTTLIIIHSAK